MSMICLMYISCKARISTGYTLVQQWMKSSVTMMVKVLEDQNQHMDSRISNSISHWQKPHLQQREFLSMALNQFTMQSSMELSKNTYLLTTGPLCDHLFRFDSQNRFLRKPKRCKSSGKTPFVVTPPFFKKVFFFFHK